MQPEIIPEFELMKYGPKSDPKSQFSYKKLMNSTQNSFLLE
jgi:hypothetical protein